MQRTIAGSVLVCLIVVIGLGGVGVGQAVGADESASPAKPVGISAMVRLDGNEEAGPVEVTDGAIVPQTIVQGDPLTVSYRVSGGGQKLSATAFIRNGAIEAPPKEWHEGAVRFEPMYQITRRDMRGKAKRAQCTLPAHVTKDMAPGPYTVFVAISNPPAGWRIAKLGELAVAAWDHVDVPARPGRPQVGIWKDDVQAVGAGSSPDHLAGLVRQAGCSPTFLTSAQLADAAALNREAFDLLVMPYGAAAPEAAAKNIAAFLKGAGALLCTGGPPLTCSAAPPSATRATRAPRNLADMENGDAVDQLGVEHGPETIGSIERVTPGSAGTRYALKVHVPELNDWFYGCFPLQDTGGHEDAVIRFWARGDENTDRLCLELNEEDGSRWKYFVKLTPDWRQHSVWMTDFASYASPSRGTAGDRLRPEKAAWLKVGFYRALFDDAKPHTVWIDQVERCAVSERLPEERLSHWAQWRQQYAYLKAVPPARGLGLLRDMRRVNDIVRVEAAHGQHVVDSATRIEGSFTGFEVTPVTALAASGHWHAGHAPSARWAPLLEGYDAKGRPAGVLAGLLLNYRGPYRGSRCAFFCVANEDLFSADKPVMNRVFVDTVRALTASAFLLDVEPAFSAENGQLRQTWKAHVANVAGRAQRLSVRMGPLGGEGEKTADVDFSAGEIREVSMSFDAGAIDLKRFGIHVVLERNGSAVDELETRADALSSLVAAGDWLLANQKADGNFSSYYYADVYGVRSLLVLGRLTGDTTYTDAAIRMADMIVRDQRSDGGWWVGYGPPRECVFVADDGCIALGLVQIAPRVDDERRRAYLNAAEKFIGFREDFRLTDEVAQELEAKYGADQPGILRGGLGIGYVRTDYFAKEPYPAAQREMRQFPWTLHCSLPFLGGLYSLTRDDRHRRLALQDTSWFLERCAEGKDAVTSAYANEAAVWMLDTLDDGAIRSKLSRELRDRFLPYVAAANRTWWTASGGRGALLLPGLVYCSRDLAPGPVATAALARALWSLCADSSPLAIPNVVERTPATSNGEVVMYVCFSSLGLAELLAPRSTMIPK